MKLNFLLGLGLVISILTMWRLIEEQKTASDNQSHLDLIMRDIGHQLLLKAGDSSSRVMPITKNANAEWLIKFQNELTLNPDDLAAITTKNLSRIEAFPKYGVNVLSCEMRDVVYGFQIFEDSSENIVPCLGRTLEKSCYEIVISITAGQSKIYSQVKLLITTLLCVIFSYLLFISVRSVRKIKDDTPKPQYFELGATQFFYEKKKLQFQNQTLQLTDKENKVLHILASNPNEMIKREELQKAVWEDNGVIVGRSLDVFISKLRKKLKVDPNLKITNVHGEGYQLEFGT